MLLEQKLDSPYEAEIFFKTQKNISSLYNLKIGPSSLASQVI
jgi:hypothetical protein